MRKSLRGKLGWEGRGAVFPVLIVLLLVGVAGAGAPVRRGGARFPSPRAGTRVGARSGSRLGGGGSRAGGRVGGRVSGRVAGRAAASGRGLRGGAARGRMASRRVDPVSRLETVSVLATTISRGGSALEFPAALGSFYAALSRHEAEPDEDTVRVVQFGDSHTAADMFTGEARRVFQREFGDGGVGYTYAGHPFAGYRIFGSQRSQTSGWSTEGTHFQALGDGLLGMGGVSVSTSRAGESVSLDAPCTTMEVQYMKQPGGGTAEFSEDGRRVETIRTDATETSAGTFRYTCGGADGGAKTVHHYVLTTGSEGPVRLFGTVALGPGVTWESIGINGAEAPLMLRWNQSLFSEYLRESAPALIALAYGTNEAASARWDEESYAATFGRLIDRLHAVSPASSILVLGPTDRATASHRAWRPFAGTDRILDAQREVCRTHGCAFWDGRKRMGGYGVMGRWVYAGWAQPDHTHLTGEGYRALADALMSDLLAGYDGYKEQRGKAGATADSLRE